MTAGAFLDGMNDVASIDKAGRVVLPKHIRDELDINPGDHLKISIRDNEVTLRPARKASGFIKRGHALVFSAGEADLLDNETVEAIRSYKHGNLFNNLTKGLSSKARK